jgi:hypothetical protein
MTTAISRRVPIAAPSEEVTPDRWHNPGFYDIALRDSGLLLGAVTLARLAVVFDRPGAVRLRR